MNTQNTQDLLEACIRTFGPTPRRHNFWQLLNYLKIDQPNWAKQDQMSLFFKHQNRLLKHGFMTWGRIVQANTHLFYPGQKDLPADVVFCTDSQRVIEPEALTGLSKQLFSLKNRTPETPELANFAEVLTNEYDRHFGLALPHSLSPDFPAELSTVMVSRYHLPNGYLSQSYFPLLVAPDHPRVVMVLPSRYWSPALVDWWIGKTASV
jgi:hypothetical protein